MKNVVKFEEMVEMGFERPDSDLVDFSDAAYEQAASRVEVISKNGMEAVFIDGAFKRMKVGGNWVSKVDSIEAATKFFKG